ncbi:hypothetical protein, partial [Lacticaseibacillus paracasei]
NVLLKVDVPNPKAKQLSSSNSELNEPSEDQLVSSNGMSVAPQRYRCLPLTGGINALKVFRIQSLPLIHVASNTNTRCAGSHC